jgi:hypothetical protein
MTRLKSPQLTAGGVSDPEPSQVPSDIETASVSLPSAHVVHSDVLTNMMHNRLHEFESGLVALQGEMEGQQQAHDKQVQELADKHTSSKADLLRRIDDLNKGKRMLSAALDAAEEESK